MSTVRIGSLPWFAGVFWWLLAGAGLILGWALFHLGDRLTGLRRPAWWLCRRVSGLTDAFNAAAMACAVEAGAEPPQNP